MKKATICFLGMIAIAALASTADAQRGNRAKDVPLPKGPARQVILKSCTSCHGLDTYAKYALDKEGWQKIVDSMKTKGAVITDEDTAILLDYLVGTFGPGSAPVVSAATLAPPTAEETTRAKTVLERACTTCHTLQRVYDNIETPDQWANTVAQMRGRGSVMTDEEAAFLANYLGRTNIVK
jgi:cytochrome c5